GAVARLVARIQELSAVATDEAHLMDALPALAGVLRYGNVRKTDAALVEPLVSGLVARITVGLVPACVSLDDDAAGAMRGRIDAVNAALLTLGRADLVVLWQDALRRLGDADVHGLVGGRACRRAPRAGAVAGQRASEGVGLARGLPRRIRTPPRPRRGAARPRRPVAERAHPRGVRGDLPDRAAHVLDVREGRAAPDRRHA